jgi:hypothetical protein
LALGGQLKIPQWRCTDHVLVIPIFSKQILCSSFGLPPCVLAF